MFYVTFLLKKWLSNHVFIAVKLLTDVVLAVDTVVTVVCSNMFAKQYGARLRAADVVSPVTSPIEIVRAGVQQRCRISV